MKILGNIDAQDVSAIEGWITDVDAPEQRINLEFQLDENVLGYCTADLFRKDLADARLAGGNCAFSYKVPPFIAKSDVSRIQIRLEGSNVYLHAKPLAPLKENGATTAWAVSRFGGLWIDRSDWLDRLASMHRRGQISDAMSLDIFRFARDGYLIFPGAVSASDVDALNTEIDRVWANPPKHLRIETFEPDGKMRVIPPDIAFRSGRTKMLDLYAVSEIARRAVAAESVVAFLTAIFEDRPKAFQGLTFWNGSQQAIHKDTAYVKVDSNPMHLAATWLALEDIEPGTGELEYFVGSHRAPDFLFGGTHKWMESNSAEHERFLASLGEDAEKYGHVRSSFLAKKGDVLVWHADLAHGGSKITNPGRTRRSLVTHFTTGVDEPFYRRSSNYQFLEANGCIFLSQYTDVRNT